MRTEEKQLVVIIYLRKTLSHCKIISNKERTISHLSKGMCHLSKLLIYFYANY